MRSKTPPEKFPIAKVALYLGILVSALCVISFRLKIERKELLDKDREISEYFKPSYLLENVIEAPINEEMSVRGPAWIVLAFFILLKRFSLRTKNYLEQRNIYGKIKIENLLFWIILTYNTAIWTSYHPYPVPTFALGIIFGWIIFATRSYLLGFPGLILVILVHIEINLFHTIGRALKINILH